jgi:hypothetical protein
VTATQATHRVRGSAQTEHIDQAGSWRSALVGVGSMLVGLLVVTVGAAVVAGLLAQPRMLPVAHRDSRTDGNEAWLLAGLPSTAASAVRTDLAQAVPAVQPLLRSLAGSVWVDAETERCHHGAQSCSYAGDGPDGRWAIHLAAQTTSATYPSNRFLVYHEVGHAVWGLLMGDTDRQAFRDAVRAALRQAPCIDDSGRPCAEIGEVFADEFARYAGGFAVSMSWYETPALLDTRTFAELARHWATAPTAPTRPVPAFAGPFAWRRP